MRYFTRLKMFTLWKFSWAPRIQYTKTYALVHSFTYSYWISVFVFISGRSHSRSLRVYFRCKFCQLFSSRDFRCIWCPLINYFLSFAYDYRVYNSETDCVIVMYERICAEIRVFRNSGSRNALNIRFANTKYSYLHLPLCLFHFPLIHNKLFSCPGSAYVTALNELNIVHYGTYEHVKWRWWRRWWGWRRRQTLT